MTAINRSITLNKYNLEKVFFAFQKINLKINFKFFLIKKLLTTYFHT